jgi:hypothetical protein
LKNVLKNENDVIIIHTTHSIFLRFVGFYPIAIVREIPSRDEKNPKNIIKK